MPSHVVGSHVIPSYVLGSYAGATFLADATDAPVIQWLLRDDFTDTVAAGSVNGTAATPFGGTRTATDTNSKLSVGSGISSFATGGVGVGDPGLWYPIQTRTAGRTLIARVTPTNSNCLSVGWDDAQTGAVEANASFVSLNLFAFGITVGTYVAGTAYDIAVMVRATGYHFFIKGGTFTNWTFLYPQKTVTGNKYPGLITRSTTSVFSCDFMRVPVSLVPITPLASDNFAGTWGTTGGSGSEESGGTNLTWTAQKGTWGSAAGVASCSALADSVGIATVPCGTTNVIVEVVATRTGGTSGLCLRYTDASNYIKAVHNGTNFQVIEVVAGTPNTLINAAATYGTVRAIVSLNGNAVRAYYNDALVNAATTAVVTGNNHGLFTDDTGATFDNFVVWAKGNSGEYETALNKYVNP